MLTWASPSYTEKQNNVIVLYLVQLRCRQGSMMNTSTYGFWSQNKLGDGLGGAAWDIIFCTSASQWRDPEMERLKEKKQGEKS